MKERKFVKLRVDMYGDTKFKIIDTMEERDLIHYIWTRLLTLAGKVNLEGKLYMSKSIPYSIETLNFTNFLSFIFNTLLLIFCVHLCTLTYF